VTASWQPSFKEIPRKCTFREKSKNEITYLYRKHGPMVSIQHIHKIFLDSKGVCTDSRKDVREKLFFALSGENFNGNIFAEQAVKNGAAAAVIDDPAFKKNDKFILVENTLDTLQKLARFHREQFNIPFIGITGTNGKTTTKELVAAVLASRFSIIATRGNYNNHIGVPLTLLSVRPDTEIAVIEMGANHRGEIKALCEIARPTHGIITNIGKAHLEGFGSFEGVVKTKSELYDFLKKNNGTAFVNAKDSLLTELSKDLRRVLYGSQEAVVSGSVTSRFPFLKVDIRAGKDHFEVATKLYGDYNLPNILAAVTAGHHFGVHADRIKSALESYVPANNRSQITQTKKNTVILDAYNANPVSLSKAIETFHDAGFKNPCLIIGDMFELGESSPDEHQKIVQLLEDKGFKCVFLAGKDFKKTKNNFITFESVEKAIEYFTKHPLENKTVLLKGSRGMHLEKLLPLL
jgi:UDP-N-acetylmuramoyl-tripeptide--D-alanyl-D-alanine ligase